MRHGTVVAIAALTAALGVLAGVLVSDASRAQSEQPAANPRPPDARSASDDATAPPTTTEPPAPESEPEQPERRWPPVRWRSSRALGEPFAGRLLHGVRLPYAGRDFVTWDPIHRTTPNRHWRRWGTRRLLRVILRVAREHRAANPDAPRLTIGDLSRPRGGDFGPRFGGLGHASHQNGLDVDIYYPRLDRREIAPRRVDRIDLALAQDLVTRFVRAGARYVFVGPATPLTGPPRRVQTLVHHDDHMHVRLLPARHRRPQAFAAPAARG
ncbi:MAG: penicillin-insensitive murein endopeptidase [Thermoleophilaceae bacterium]